jgi:hypothetical protein
MDTLLAQPAGDMRPADVEIRKDYWPEKRKVLQRVEQLRQNRLRWEDQWIDIRNYELPFIGDFKRQGDDTYPGRRRDLHIAQGCAWASCQVFAAGIMSGLTPPSRQWFKFQFSNSDLNENVQAGQVLDERQDIMQSVLANSNFYNAIHSSYFELPYGQAPLAVLPDTKRGVRFQAQSIGTYYIDVGGDGKVNTFCRRYPMKLQQIIDTFGVEALPYNDRQRLAGGAIPDNVLRYVWWLVQPNAQAVPGRIGRLNMPFISMYWVDGCQENEWLYVGGFEEFPVPTGRYLVNANNAYGYGPGWYALGDSKSLQVMKRDYLTAVELSVKPPLVATADVMAEGINLIPGGVTKAPGPQSRVDPLFNVQLDLPHLAEEIIRTEDSIKRAYSADLFLMLDSITTGNMTAREIVERQQEKLQQLGPVVERLQEEYLTPILERTYNILDRAGVFPPIPPDIAELIAEEDVKIEYISPLAQAQKMSGLVNIEQAIAFIAQMAQIWPDAIKAVDPLGTVAKYKNMLGAPAKMRRPEEEVQQMIQQEQQAMAQAQQEQQAMQVAQALPGITQAAKNATEAANDGNPALADWLGMSGVV